MINISLVLGLVIATSGMKVEDPGMRRDWTTVLLVPLILTGILWDGWFSRGDAIFLVVIFMTWLFLVVRHARRYAGQHFVDVEEVERIPSQRKSLIIVQTVGGLLLLIGAAQFVVVGGKGVATALGWSPFVIGAVVIALATGTPELATTIIARVRGHHDVGIANILGSNVFNALFIASVAALIHPYRVNFRELVPSLVFAVVTTLMIFPGSQGIMLRWRGVMLLILYGAYLATTLV